MPSGDQATGMLLGVDLLLAWQSCCDSHPTGGRDESKKVFTRLNKVEVLLSDVIDQMTGKMHASWPLST